VRRAATLLAGAAAAGLGAWTGFVEPRRLVIRRDELAIPHWPQALDGLRVGAIADIHGGSPYMGRDGIARAVDRLNAERTDLVVLLGDYVDASILWARRMGAEVVASELARLESPSGVFAVLGNHDWKSDGDHVWRALAARGITVLENEARAVEARGTRLWIAGVADVRHRRADPEGTVAQAQDDEPVLLLAHDPDVFPHVPERVSLTLSGHLHAGQIAIPVLRRPTLPSWYGERYARRHVVEGGRHLYVSSGLGTTGLPARLNAPPELVVLTLRRDEAAGPS
jgi:predicted MPP superfamily phosphohydrolase